LEILQVVGLGIIATILIMLLKTYMPEMAVQVSIITGIAMFILIAVKLTAILDLLKTYTEKIDIDTQHINVLIKIVGIAYIAEFGSEICKDAGQSAIATKIELAGKVIIAALAFPIIASLLDLIVRIMP
jgi:stage III sporulation protein AD